MDLKSRIFIIDDDPIYQRIAQIMITKHNLFDEYSSYNEAQKALDFLKENIKMRRHFPMSFFSTLNMPVIDGWGFLEAFEILFKDFKKNIRVFIVSSSVDEKDLLRSKLFAGVKGFISKPLSPDIIRSIK